MARTNPSRMTGLLVTDAPPTGQVRSVTVVSVVEYARNDDRARVAYKVMFQCHLTPTVTPNAPVPEGQPRVTYVVVERQPDGDWLVLSQTDELDPVE